MNFKEMRDSIKKGQKAFRAGWPEDAGDRFVFWIGNNKWTFESKVLVDVPTDGFIAVYGITKRVQPFMATQSDRMAQDWQILEVKNEKVIS